jgi:hypothetical protein
VKTIDDEGRAEMRGEERRGHGRRWVGMRIREIE